MLWSYDLELTRKYSIENIIHKYIYRNLCINWLEPTLKVIFERKDQIYKFNVANISQPLGLIWWRCWWWECCWVWRCWSGRFAQNIFLAQDFVPRRLSLIRMLCSEDFLLSGFCAQEIVLDQDGVLRKNVLDQDVVLRKMSLIRMLCSEDCPCLKPPKFYGKIII